MIRLQGRIDDIIFHNEENGYTVMLFETTDGYETAVGFLPSINIGENLIIEGEHIHHERYGKQLKIEHYEVLLPTEIDEIEHYLGSGLIHGVGPQLAKRIVDHFGEDVFTILDERPERLMEISGIGEKKYEAILESYLEQRRMKHVMIQLQKIGISNTISMKLYKQYGDSVIDIVRKNPYRISDDVSGIGFKYVDKLATTIGVEKESPYRLQSGVKHVLATIMNDGHTYSLRNNLVRRASQLLGASEALLQDAITELLIQGDLCIEKKAHDEHIYLTPYHAAEVNIAKKIMVLSAGEKETILKAPQAIVEDLQTERHVKLAEKQLLAIETALNENMMILTGGPGTGKTTIIDFIIKLYDLGEKRILLSAPTGRAAKRMTEATGMEAKTIHRLLEYSPQAENGWSGFNRNEDNPLEADLIIVDEVSMVDLLLMNHLLKAIQIGTRLILVGDADQLQSVGSGNVLSDLIESGVMPLIQLNEIFRQDEESMIVVNAHRINQGESPIVNRKEGGFFFIESKNQKEMLSTIIELCQKRLPEYYGYDSIEDIQVLSPMKGSLTGVENLNAVLQEVLNPPNRDKSERITGNRVLREGDKVMQIKNNYSIKWQSTRSYLEGDGVFNGDIGQILRVNKDVQTVDVIFDHDRLVKYEFSQLDELIHAYAVTVHKSQGSEFQAVIMPVCGSAPLLMTRNILYTAITRAQKTVVLVGNEKWLMHMIQNNQSKERFSGLKERLVELKKVYESDEGALWGML